MATPSVYINLPCILFYPISTNLLLGYLDCSSTGKMPDSSDDVPNYMGWSIFTCLCCFWPLGIPAIITSNSVSLLYSKLTSMVRACVRVCVLACLHTDSNDGSSCVLFLGTFRWTKPKRQGTLRGQKVHLRLPEI